MRIAVTKGTLRIPPTYFAIAHAQRLQDSHNLEIFSLVANVEMADLTVAVRDFVPARALGFRTREIVMPAFMPRMIRAIGAYSPDLIHQHFATWSWPAATASSRYAIPMITTLHGADVFVSLRPATTRMAKWHKRNVRLANDQSSKLLAVSEFLADRAVAAGLDARKIEVHYQGIDTSFFTPAAIRPSDDELPVVLFAGGLSERKGIRDLLRASSIAQLRSPHRLVVAGGGELEREVHAETANNTRIELIGPQNRTDIRKWMRQASVLVVPSRTHSGWQEAAGLVALEAAACGTPVVAYDCGGLREMMIDAETGLLVREGDVRALAHSIRDIINLPPSELNAMGSAARSFAIQSRSLDVSTADLEAHYRNVTSG